MADRIAKAQQLYEDAGYGPGNPLVMELRYNTSDNHKRIALAVAQVNGCDYCLSAHTYLGLNLAKISPEEIALNRKGESNDDKAGAAVRFAAKVAVGRRVISSRKGSS